MKKQSLIITIALILSLVSARYAAADDAQSDFFREGTTAKAFSTGYTGVSNCNDVSATYWNPAGLAKVTETQFLTTKTTQEFFDSDVQSFSVAAPLGDTVSMGFSYVRSSTDFPITGIDGTTGRVIITGYSSDKYTGTALALGGKLSENVFVGVNIKNMKHKLYNSSESGTGYDIGFLGQWENFRAGMNLQNIGDVNLGTDKVPFNVRLGISGDLAEERLTLALSYDTDYLGESGLGVGADFKVADQFSARLGSYDGDFAYGFGVNIENFSIDYALTSGSGVNETNKFTLSYKLMK